MKNINHLATLVASGRASAVDMDALGADLVEQIKSTPGVFQIRGRGSDVVSKNEAKRQITYIASDETPDRVGDIIQVRGWDLAAYKRNPVVLWAHDGQSAPPIGRAVNVRRRYGDSPRLTADIEFAPKEAHEFADTVYQLASRGFIRATSVGFLPKETLEVDEKDRVKMGLGKYGQVYSKAELMEISVVAVPANPSALEEGVKQLTFNGILEKEMAEKFFETYPKSEEIALRRVRAACRSFVDFGAAQHLADSIAEPADAYNTDDPVEQAVPEALDATLEERMAKPPLKTPKAPVGQKWDAAKVWSAIADNYEGEDKAKKYWDIVAYMVPDADPEARSSYKFPHHDEDGRVVWHGITAAMAALNGARGGATGLSEKDRKGVYRHLVAHYEQFEEEAPALRSADELVEEKSPTCREDGETIDECVARKVPEMIDEGMERDQAVAAAHSMCETKCSEEYSSESVRLVEAMASLVEHQAEQTKATRQLVDGLSDLVKAIHSAPLGGVEGSGSVYEPDAATPDAEGGRMTGADVEELFESTAFRGFADRVRRDLLTNNTET